MCYPCYSDYCSFGRFLGFFQGFLQRGIHTWGLTQVQLTCRKHCVLSTLHRLLFLLHDHIETFACQWPAWQRETVFPMQSRCESIAQSQNRNSVYSLKAQGQKPISSQGVLWTSNQNRFAKTVQGGKLVVFLYFIVSHTPYICQLDAIHLYQPHQLKAVPQQIEKAPPRITLNVAC